MRYYTVTLFDDTHRSHTVTVVATSLDQAHRLALAQVLADGKDIPDEHACYITETPYIQLPLPLLEHSLCNTCLPAS